MRKQQHIHTLTSEQTVQYNNKQLLNREGYCSDFRPENRCTDEQTARQVGNQAQIQAHTTSESTETQRKNCNVKKRDGKRF